MVSSALDCTAHEEGTSPRTSIEEPASSNVHDPALGPAPAAVH
jgi:hypothetical protein